MPEAPYYDYFIKKDEKGELSIRVYILQGDCLHPTVYLVMILYRGACLFSRSFHEENNAQSWIQKLKRIFQKLSIDEILILYGAEKVR